MSDGKLLKSIIDEVREKKRIDDKRFRLLIKKHLSRGYPEGQVPARVSNRVGYIMGTMRHSKLTIKRCFEFYDILGYTELELTMDITKGSETYTVKVPVDLNINKANYGVYLKSIVDQLNIKFEISPCSLANNLSIWVTRNFPYLSTADIDHKAGNIAKALSTEHITWKRLLDYLNMFDPDKLVLTILAESTEEAVGGTSTITLNLDMEKRKNDERKVRAETKELDRLCRGGICKNKK